MTLRILHTADLHLDSPLRSLAMKDDRLAAQVRGASRQALETMVQYCIDERVSAFLISGDLYDGQERSAKTAAYLAAQMHRLAQADVRVFYIKGNPIAGEIDLPPNVHVFDGRGEKVQLADYPVYIHGVSFRDRHAPESLLPKYTVPEAGAVNIAMMHTSLAGAEGHDLYAPVSVGELAGAGFDYWALGHVHKRAVHSEDPWIVMPGMPQGRDIGEAGPKSASLLTIEDGKISVSEVATSVVELRRKLRSALQAQAGRGAAILRLRVTGQTALAWQIRQLADVWRAQADEIAESIGDLWIEKMSVDVTAVSEDAVDGAVAEVQQLMTDIAKEPATRDRLQQELSQILGLLPADQRRALAPDAEAQEALLRQLTDEAVLTMAAQMRGAGE